MNMVERTTVYFPDKSIKQGYPSLFKEMFNEAASSWWLTSQLFRRNFTALYKQSMLGILWALVIPLASVAVFIFLNRGGIFDVGEIAIPYPLFAVAGIAFWQVFSLGLTLSANSLVTAGAMIRRLNFPRKSLVVSSVAQGFVPCLFQMGVVLILFAVYQIVPPLTVLLVPLAMLPLILLTLGLGFLLSLVNAVMRDVGNGISIIVTFLLFATPVLYAKPASGIVATVSQYNPLYYLVSVPRDLFVLGSTTELQGFAYATLFSIAVFLICWIVFHLTETRVTERV